MLHGADHSLAKDYNRLVLNHHIPYYFLDIDNSNLNLCKQWGSPATEYAAPPQKGKPMKVNKCLKIVCYLVQKICGFYPKYSMKEISDEDQLKVGRPFQYVLTK